MFMHGPLQAHEVAAKGFIYDEVPGLFAAGFAGRHKGECRKASISCLFSHVQVWKTIANDITSAGSIICEDDARQVRAIDYNLLRSTSSIVLLGGHKQYFY